MFERTLHPVVHENLHTPKPNGPHWELEARDRHGLNPSLFGYTAEEPTARRLGQFARHYATKIFAMPHEVVVTCKKRN